ncbi:FG-GAP-like repeat-containing protein [Lacinutrix iliipiscaria]|uniref:FG-GAP-like repeat-containing protein n=1 Tax=Lacinutrix iliipiscaria TaxID=1230532 RepID=A0ABW5WTG0_9FLAO
MIRRILLLCCFIFSVTAKAQISFADQASGLGLDAACGTTIFGNGITFYDFNSDGWDDVTINTESGESLRFFENLNGTFQEIFLEIPDFIAQTKQVNWVDFDNDGDKDLFVTSDLNGNKLFENVGDLVFQDITAASGISLEITSSFGASWGDYNNDGFLDLFISNKTPLLSNKLYRNNGDHTFTDVSTEAGISPDGHGSFCAAFFDFNNDGFQDIYISNDRDFNPNILYKNNGDGTFADVSESSGTNAAIDAMTVTIGDFNNDGWFDIYVTNGIPGNVLYKNNGDETFTDIALESGTTFNSVSWGASFLDADNDMDLDLYVCGSFDASIEDYLNGGFYINNNDETFNLNNESFPGDNRASYSSALGDIDNDGYPEIVVANSNDENVFLWKNNTATTNNWLKINLEGVESNRDGVGSVIEISTDGNKQYNYTLCGEGYLSQNSATEMFGLGTHSSVDYVKVTWLSGAVDVLNNVTANQTLHIVEGSNPQLSIDEFESSNRIKIYPNPVKNTLFLETNTFLDNSIFNVEIVSILGQKQRVAYQNKSNKINVSNFSNGLYFLKLTTSNGQIIQKFIKE